MSEQPLDEVHRQSLARKTQVVCDHATAVAKGYKTGFYLHGTGGVGKSHAVLGQFERLGVSYRLHNSRMTGLGLFLALKAAPDATHVLEDMERITKDPDAQGVLRSALWSQPDHDRTVTWTTAKNGRMSFPFRGGLVLISNRPLADLPELRALATRIEVYHMAVSDAELTVLMRDIAAAGLRVRDRLVLAPDECGRVTEHLLRECREAGCPLDLRLQQKAFQTYRQHAADCSWLHWEDLIAVSVSEATCHFKHEVTTDSPEARAAHRRDVVRELLASGLDAKELERRYQERTGHSRADFFRRKGEVASGAFDESDAG